jgi:enolase
MNDCSGGARIVRIHGRQILDSRGSPTVEVDVELKSGSFGRASVPSGASTGRHEAWELRDGDDDYFRGRGVKSAVANIQRDIGEALIGQRADDQEGIDRKLTLLDGTPNLARLGANAVLGTSLAVARAAAVDRRVPLYRYIMELARAARPSLPMPMANILSGGAHAGRHMDFQDFLAIPLRASRYSEALELLARVRSAADELMRQAGRSTLLADEGGLGPAFARAEDALELMMQSFEHARLQPGRDVAIAIDVAASQLRQDGGYRLESERRNLCGEEMVHLVGDLVRNYPIISVEDALDQDDWEHWTALGVTLPDVQLVGDDLFATNMDRLALGINRGAANAVLVKPNQNGTLTGTLAVMDQARRASYATVVSARSGETEDNFIADLAVGTGAGQIKIGSLRNSERLAKYNQLLRLEEDARIPFAGVSGIAKLSTR